MVFITCTNFLSCFYIRAGFHFYLLEFMSYRFFCGPGDRSCFLRWVWTRIVVIKVFCSALDVFEVLSGFYFILIFPSHFQSTIISMLPLSILIHYIILLPGLIQSLPTLWSIIHSIKHT